LRARHGGNDWADATCILHLTARFDEIEGGRRGLVAPCLLPSQSALDDASPTAAVRTSTVALARDQTDVP
jgi:hypothetical protein